MELLTERHMDRLAGVLSCYDRMITGTLPGARGVWPVLSLESDADGIFHRLGISLRDHPHPLYEPLSREAVLSVKAEQVSTSGATSGGETASFLKGETKQGDALIKDLLKAPEPAVVASAAARAATNPAPAPVTPAGADHSVIGDLLSASAPLPSKPVTPARGPSVPTPKPAVDDSVIGSLLDLPKSDKPNGGAP